jgi:NAD(P)-dependent dehydrogenase (short-subunit alcohol dehydrogenase family)
MEALGHIDILVNNASIQHYRESLADITPEQLEATFRTNVFGYFFMAQVGGWGRRGQDGRGGAGTFGGSVWQLHAKARVCFFSQLCMHAVASHSA